MSEFITIEKNTIDNAALEAIYWWNRGEHYYHRYFSNFEVLYKDKKLLDFFIIKVFEVFLREYSVRRNISAGYEKVSIFIDELFENKFIINVKKGETYVIDELSNILKRNGKSTTMHTRSLLSKIAYLINPKDFTLYDTLAKKSIYKIYKNTIKPKSELDKYSFFIKKSFELRKYLKDNDMFSNIDSLLHEFKGTEAHNYFNNNTQAFEMRIVDKLLWISEQNNLNNRTIENNKYKSFNEIR